MRGQLSLAPFSKVRCAIHALPRVCRGCACCDSSERAVIRGACACSATLCCARGLLACCRGVLPVLTSSKQAIESQCHPYIHLHPAIKCTGPRCLGTALTSKSAEQRQPRPRPHPRPPPRPHPVCDAGLLCKLCQLAVPTVDTVVFAKCFSSFATSLLYQL